MILFLALIIGIYYFSRLTVREIFFFLRKIFKSDRPVLIFVTIILLPGTIIHELSHFLVALALMLPVRSISIIPTYEAKEIRLGEVKFEKRDFIRGGLVGVAPFFLGIILLLFIFYFRIFPGEGIIFNAIMSYLIFSVSSNMFSSSQDLKDIIFVVPVLLLVFTVFYVFDIKLDMDFINAIMNEASYYLIYVFAINAGLFFSLKILNNIVKK